MVLQEVDYWFVLACELFVRFVVFGIMQEVVVESEFIVVVGRIRWDVVFFVGKVVNMYCEQVLCVLFCIEGFKLIGSYYLFDGFFQFWQFYCYVALIEEFLYVVEGEGDIFEKMFFVFVQFVQFVGVQYLYIVYQYKVVVVVLECCLVDFCKLCGGVEVVVEQGFLVFIWDIGFGLIQEGSQVVL